MRIQLLVPVESSRPELRRCQKCPVVDGDDNFYLEIDQNDGCSLGEKEAGTALVFGCLVRAPSKGVASSVRTRTKGLDLHYLVVMKREYFALHQAITLGTFHLKNLGFLERMEFSAIILKHCQLAQGIL